MVNGAGGQGQFFCIAQCRLFQSCKRIAWQVLFQLAAIGLKPVLVTFQLALETGAVVVGAVGAVVEETDEHADALEKPDRQTIARVMQDGLVERHVAVQGVRAQTVDLQHVIHLATGAADELIHFIESAGGLVRTDDLDVGHFQISCLSRLTGVYHTAMFRLAVVLIALLLTSSCESAATVRVATFNIAMGLKSEGQLGQALKDGRAEKLQQIAEILQRVRPDIVLLNEFDYDPSVDAPAFLNEHYLAQGQNGQAAINYPYHFRAPVNTGVDSGRDLDGDGETGGPGDSWGFGHFPGQYGMLVLSRYPLKSSRSFREFRWANMPAALRPTLTDGSDFYSEETWELLRLSSKSHWDLQFEIDGKPLHLLAHHPTPPVFDGPEDRNGRRNFDEIRFWRDYVHGDDGYYIIDDQGQPGGLAEGASFIIAGDFNADPMDGDAVDNAIGQLLQSPRINTHCTPVSSGAAETARSQGGLNDTHKGDPAADTADFNDEYTGNLRLDYVLPSSDLVVSGCGVFWPAAGQAGHALAQVSDHRLVWVDIKR